MGNSSNSKHSNFVAHLMSCDLTDDQIKKLLDEKFTQMEDLD